ncbi:MAG TPA: RsmG family class I SAM-dependent methyltransferase [Polyangiaceae bacterium]|jgi:16S rRNA (guanine527-N7)-methyltransferase|nr:RsmG family class I SAM-dependent methyltransferase [Polyangiaceae bacterium]
MTESVRPPRQGWQPLIERSIAALPEAAAPLDGVWGSGAERAAACAALGRLLDLVLLWNQRVDLTAARSPEELVDLYLTDALVIAARAGREPNVSWIDVGSGAGAPGLVLQLLRPDLQLTLVEPRSKRVAFLRTAIGQLRLGAKVVGARSDSIGGGACDLALSRATFPPEEWLVEGARLARRGVWVLLARGSAPGRDGWQATIEIDYEWPLTRVARRALCFTPVSASTAQPAQPPSA